MSDVRFYFSLFLRRIPIFLPVVSVLSAIGIIVAFTLPPAYESSMRLFVESPRIPTALAPSTVQLPPLELLEIVRQRLLTRENLVRIAREQQVFENIDAMSVDQIVNGMRARTTIAVSSARDNANLMTVDFEARAPRIAASVLGEYLTLIEQEDARVRQSRAGDTLEFFEQQARQLGEELADQAALILNLKNENAGALPETLDFRVGLQRDLQNQLSQVEFEQGSLREQRERIIELFDATGQVDRTAGVPPSQHEQELFSLRSELRRTLGIYNENSPRVEMIRNQIESLEAEIAGIALDNGDTQRIVPSALDAQLAEIETRMSALERRRAALETSLDAVNRSIEKTPEVSISLVELERQYSSLQGQLELAQSRLATARTGELIETRSRGQEISVIEMPAVPSQPTKPNRLLIALGSIFFGLASGFGLVLILELLNNTARRSEDLVRRFDITPLAAIPIISTRGELFLLRTGKIAAVLAILLGAPAAVYAVHNYYLPLDQLAERVMNTLGVRL